MLERAEVDGGVQVDVIFSRSPNTFSEMRGWTPFMIQSVPLVVGGRAILFIGMILRVFWTFYKHLRLPTRGTRLKPGDQAVFNNQTTLRSHQVVPTHLRTPRNAETARTMSETRRTDAAVDRAAVFGRSLGVETGYLLQTTGFQNPRNRWLEECFFLPNAGFSSCWSFGGIQTGRVCETMSPSFVTNDVGSHIGGHSNPLVPYSIISSISVDFHWIWV